MEVGEVTIPTNLTGAQGDQSLDCTVNQYNFSGNATQNAGTTTEFVTGAGTPQEITWGGSFTFVTTGTGNIKVTGTAAKRLRFQPSGAVTTWSWAGAANSFLQSTSTGGLTLIYLDMFWSVPVMDQTGGTSSQTFVRVFWGRPTGNLGDGFFFRPSGGTHTFTDCEAWNCRDTANGAFRFSITGGTNTIARLHCFGAGVGFYLQTSVAITVNDIKAVRCQTGVVFGGAGAVTGTNWSTIDCRFATSTATAPGASSTITRWFNAGSHRGTTLSGGITITPGAVVITFSECYSGSEESEPIANLSTLNPERVVTNGCVGARPRASMHTTDDALYYVTATNCDAVGYAANGRFGQLGGTSDQCYYAGNNGAQIGSVPADTEGPLEDHASTNHVEVVDGDSGNTTSTSTPAQYSTLSANRTNPRATPNKPLTISSISSGTPTSGAATITFTTGIKARSRILIGTATGVTRANATMVSPWKYHGILDPEMVDFTLPVTSHSHALVNLKANTTYYYVVECYDPCGRRFLGAEASFATTAAGGGGSVFGGGVVR